MRRVLGQKSSCERHGLVILPIVDEVLERAGVQPRRCLARRASITRDEATGHRQRAP